MIEVNTRIEAARVERMLLIAACTDEPGARLMAIIVEPWRCGCGFEARTLPKMFDHVTEAHPCT